MMSRPFRLTEDRPRPAVTFESHGWVGTLRYVSYVSRGPALEGLFDNPILKSLTVEPTRRH